MLIENVLAMPKLTNYIKENLDDLWRGTFLQGYRYMGNKQKGVFGELFALEYLKSKGFKVNGRQNNDTDYDLLVEGLRVEVKFSVALTETNKKTGVQRLVKDKFMMNHIGIGKDYDRILFIGINPIFKESRIVWFDKKDIKKSINNDEYFDSQQGGKKSDNDDYMCGAKKLMKLINSNYAKTLDQWND